MKASHTIRAVFDDPNLVSAAGLVPVLRLAESAGLGELLSEHLSVPSPNAAAKTTAVLAGMLAGADSIDDLDLLRHGAMPRLFTGVRAPSTLGTFLRSFTHGHVQQLNAVGTRLLVGLAAQVPGLLAGGDASGIAFVDVDDTVREVHGFAKQGAAFGYTRQRGLNVQPVAVDVHGRRDEARRPLTALKDRSSSARQDARSRTPPPGRNTQPSRCAIHWRGRDGYGKLSRCLLSTPKVTISVVPASTYATSPASRFAIATSPA